MQSYSQISQNLSQASDNTLQSANLNPSNFATVTQAQQAINSALQNPTSRNALLQGAVAAGQATVTQLGQMLQTTNAEAAMQASMEKNKQAEDNTSLAVDNGLNNYFSGGAPTSNAPGKFAVPPSLSQ